MAETPERIIQLVETFSRNLDIYKTGEMNETQLRRQYIDPFFTALGWDVENKKGYASAYKEVSHEYSLKTKDVREAPDYCFRIGQTPKFFLEAKKPNVNLKEDIHPAFQVRSYAWSAKLPLSILTDFEEFAVYDCRIPPHKNDKASTARVIYYTYDQYIDQWEEIVSIFSREAILKGSFDKYIESNKKKKGTAEVDSVFLCEMEEWRKLIARNIALRNPSLSIRELNYVVQKTIDRIIFLRICEDRGIEDYGQLMALQNGTNVYERLKIIYDRADEKYNSGLFHFREEKDRGEEPDHLSHNLIIDDKVLKDIFKNLYYPESPYEFSVLPADILGQVYEQFLGKVIRLTQSHQAVIEDKPEVKKAGGVYYTPTYIVDYIVQNTVSKIIDNKKPNEVAKLKILDPACGSGSFLLGAFQYLLNWHNVYYVKDDDTIKKYSTQKQPAIYQSSNGDWLLTTTEKKRILLNNIHGVDIDSQAVEVTKLSLLLKVLEGESEQTISNQMKFFKERALPDLSNNIKCGNSLIGSDFYDQMEMNFLDDDEKLQINVFDWKSEFKEIMAGGGFDVVIGNPPYMRIQTLHEFQSGSIEYLKANYMSATYGNIDIYLLFIEKAMLLLNDKAKAGYILPHKFFQAEMGKNIRELLSNQKAIEKVVNFGANQIFKNATTYTCLLFFNKSNKEIFNYFKFDLTKDIKEELNKIKFKEIAIRELENNVWNFYAGAKDSLLQKMYAMPFKLLDITDKVFVGLQTSADKIYVLKNNNSTSKSNSNLIEVYSKSLNKNITIESGLLKPFLMGKDVKRYEKSINQSFVIFPYVIKNDKAELMGVDFIKKNYPYGWEYLIANKKDLENRENGKMKGENFYAYIYPKNLTEFESLKIMTPEIALGCQFTIDREKALYHTTKVYSIRTKTTFREGWKYLIAILNSKLLWFFIKSTGYTLRGGYFTFKTKYLNPFPIKRIDFKDKTEKEILEKLEFLVENIFEFILKINSIKSPTEKTVLQRQVDAVDKQIDQLVYQLYNLTEEEIRIVEGESQ
jgi:adenine-specific DNA-methyltransferase